MLGLDLRRKTVVSYSFAPFVLLVPSCTPPGPDVVDDTTDGTGPDDVHTSSGGTTDDETGIVDSGSEEGSSSSDTGLEPSCGDGIVDEGETCDASGESPTCDADCTPVECGDMTVNAAAEEDCDGIDLVGATCESLGFTGGTLSCSDGCTFDTSGCSVVPAFPVLELSFSQVKRFDFHWDAAAGATYYRLEESAAPGEPFVQVGGDITGESISLEVPLHLRFEASYRLHACNPEGCTGSAEVGVTSSLAEAVGYVKAYNTGSNDAFGFSVALSGDGNTLAVGANGESSSSTGINNNGVNDFAPLSGAVYVFVRDDMGGWSQQAYIKSSNVAQADRFGASVALSDDGNTLAIGATGEDSNATGINGDQGSNLATDSGAAYVFVRHEMGDWWEQTAYVKASYGLGQDNVFGASVAVSGDGSTIAVGAPHEDSNATGIDGDPTNYGAPWSGAVYVFVHDGAGEWSQQAYVKASNTGQAYEFGSSVALSYDGDTLAVGSWGESSNATGIDGDQTNFAAWLSGAVYVFGRDGMDQWSQQAYVKASNTDEGDAFGRSIALSDDGDTLAVGAPNEDSSAAGVDGDQADDSMIAAGAIYVFARQGGGSWSQQAYIKASSPSPSDYFGVSVALSDDGSTLAAGAWREDGNATGVGGDPLDESAEDSGAVDVFVRDGMGAWAHRAYVKASNPGVDDRFGGQVALSGDGRTLAVGSAAESSNATGIAGDQANDDAVSSGAVYLY